MNTPHPVSRPPFDFGAAITQLFQAGKNDEGGGRRFAMKLSLIMASAYFLLFAVTMPLILPVYPELLEMNWQNMQDISDGRTPGNAGMGNIFAKIALPYTVMVLGFLLLGAMGEGALHRKILRGNESNRYLLRVSRDEGRILLAQLGVWGAWLLAYIVGLIAVMAAGGLLSVISPVLGGIVSFVFVIGLICLMVLVPVRLAPAAALSVDARAPRLMAARPVSKGRFWPLFGAYTVVIIAGYVGIYIVMGIAMYFIFGGGDMTAAMSGLGTENPKIAFEAAAQRLRNPLVLIMSLVGLFAYSLAFSLFSLSMGGVGAYAVKLWRGEESTADVFS